MKNGELNPCRRQEKLGEVLPGHQPYRMAKALWDHSIVEKHETGEHARLVVVQDPRDTVKAGLPESQSPGMEAHIHRHGMYGRCPWNRTVSLSSSELFLQGTTVSEIVQGDEQDTYVALERSNVRTRDHLQAAPAFDPEWTLPSMLDRNPLVWMAEVNGYLVDLRTMPREVQEIAFEKGLIPYIPDDHT